MSQTVSPSTSRCYGLARVSRAWSVSRAGVYRFLKGAPSPAIARRRPGPTGPCPDADLADHIRREIEASDFHGEGYRKLWARLRVAGVRSSPRRVRRVMGDNRLLAPHRVGRNQEKTLNGKSPAIAQPTSRAERLTCSAMARCTSQAPSGFARHVIAYNINSFSIALLLFAWHGVGGAYAMLFLSTIAALVFLWRQNFTTSAVLTSLGPSNARRVLAVVTLWLGFAALMTLTAGKEGSNVNYFIELLHVGAIPVAMMAAITWRKIVLNYTSGNGGVARVMAFSLTAALLVQLNADKSYRYTRIDDREGRNIQLALISEVARSMQPVLSDDMVLLLRAGQEVQIEPAIFMELAKARTWNQAPFLEQLKNNAFAFVIEEEGSTRYTPEMLAAIAQAYPLEEKLGPYRISRPLKR